MRAILVNRFRRNTSKLFLDISTKFCYTLTIENERGINQMTIYFDMDGTIANLYGVENWLEYLESADPYPYKAAEPMCDLRQLARTLNKLQKLGYEIGIVSWLSKNSTPAYDEAVRRAKRRWLAEHLTSVDWDELHFVKYGTPKQFVVRDREGILFDDEARNREAWWGEAFEPNEIFDVLGTLF